MRDPKRLDKLYEKLRTFHKEVVPDWRFCQVTENFKRWAAGNGVPDIFFLEDDRFIKLFDQFAAENKKYV